MSQKSTDTETLGQKLIEAAKEASELNFICIKGMKVRECPYNPRLGCDCGFWPAYNNGK